jgi:SPP1 gp7 family putative phage head morphogenesis protein
MAEAQPFDVAPLEAIEYLRQKVRVPTRAWTDVWQGMHARAFVVAGAQSDALLADFHEAVTAAIAEGRTIEDFRKDFDRIVETHGWSYKGSPGWRSRVIFETNLRMAYSAGRWAQVQEVKRFRPYLRYVALMDGRTRPLHAAWHNTVLHADDPWWKTHYPPNGWNCRCTVQSLAERDVPKVEGAKLQAPPSKEVVKTINGAAGPVRITVPEGIDPGFAYNPGEAGFGRGKENLALERHGPFTPLEAPGAPPARLDPLPLDPIDFTPPALPSSTDLREQLAAALGGPEVVVTDPLDRRVLLGQALADQIEDHPELADGREAWWGALPGVIEAAAEIWSGFVTAPSGRVVLRRRYLRRVETPDGRRTGIIADVDEGTVSGFTLFRSVADGARKLRTGLRLWWRAGA